MDDADRLHKPSFRFTKAGLINIEVDKSAQSEYTRASPSKKTSIRTQSGIYGYLLNSTPPGAVGTVNKNEKQRNYLRDCILRVKFHDAIINDLL